MVTRRLRAPGVLCLEASLRASGRRAPRGPRWRASTSGRRPTARMRSTVWASPVSDDWTISSRPPGRRCSETSSSSRSTSTRPSTPPSHARATPRVGRVLSPGKYGGLARIRSKLSPATGASTSPRRIATRKPARRALSQTESRARRETSTAVTVLAPSRAAASASAPLPVNTSSTSFARAHRREESTWASITASPWGGHTPEGTRTRSEPEGAGEAGAAAVLTASGYPPTWLDNLTRRRRRGAGRRGTPRRWRELRTCAHPHRPDDGAQSIGVRSRPCQALNCVLSR